MRDRFSSSLNYKQTVAIGDLLVELGYKSHYALSVFYLPLITYISAPLSILIPLTNNLVCLCRVDSLSDSGKCLDVMDDLSFWLDETEIIISACPDYTSERSLQEVLEKVKVRFYHVWTVMLVLS